MSVIHHPNHYQGIRYTSVWKADPNQGSNAEGTTLGLTLPISYVCDFARVLQAGSHFQAFL